jgi:serine/threonine protein kinase
LELRKFEIRWVRQQQQQKVRVPAGAHQVLVESSESKRDHAGSDHQQSSSTRVMQLPRGVQVQRSTFKQSHSIQISGRHGYMALEEKVGGLITPKLDVFAFGVILLEIMSSKEAVSFCTADQTGTNTLKKTLLPDVHPCRQGTREKTTSMDESLAWRLCSS